MAGGDDEIGVDRIQAPVYLSQGSVSLLSRVTLLTMSIPHFTIQLDLA